METSRRLSHVRKSPDSPGRFKALTLLDRKLTGVRTYNSDDRDERGFRIAEVVDRLSKSYPTLLADTVVEVVNDMRAALHLKPCANPCFVERRARAALTELAV